MSRSATLLAAHEAASEGQTLRRLAPHGLGASPGGAVQIDTKKGGSFKAVLPNPDGPEAPHRWQLSSGTGDGEYVLTNAESGHNLFARPISAKTKSWEKSFGCDTNRFRNNDG